MSTRAPAATVLCVGQATLDHVFTVDGELRAGHKHVAGAHATVGGGVAANAAVTVARLGGHAVIAGRIGDDHAGDLVAAGLEAEGVDIRLLGREPGAATPVSAVIVGPDGDRTIVNHTPTHLFDGEPPDFDDLAPDAVLVDGRWPTGTAVGLRLARRLGVAGVVDVDRRPRDDEFATMCDLASHLVFGRDAAAAVTGASDPALAVRRLAATIDAAATTGNSTLVAVTCGEQGVWWSQDGDVAWLPALSVEAVDTTAAGDVFHGALALALAEGMPIADALGFATTTSAIKCSRRGAREGIPARREVEELLADPVGGH